MVTHEEYQTFLNSDDKDQITAAMQSIKKRIRSSADRLTQKMMTIVEGDVMRNETDFYFHNLMWLSNNRHRPFLWLVLNEGTRIVELDSAEFDENGNWVAANRFRELLHVNRHVISGFYLIERGNLSRISFQSAMCQIAIYEDEARWKQRLSSKRLL